MPLGEESEAYEVDILDGANVIRTLEASGPQVVYPAADQVADFAVMPPAVAVRDHQMSASFGRGAPGEAEV